MIRRIVAACLLCGVWACHAQPADPAIVKAIESTRDEVTAAVTELNTLRDEIAAKRVPRAAELESLSREVRQLRHEVDRVREVRMQNATQREALGRELGTLEDEHAFIQTLLREYRREYETRLSVAEAAAMGPRLADVDAAGTNLVRLADVLLALSESSNRDRLGGHTFRGECLDAAGVALPGTFAVFGPVGYFAADDDAGGGLVVGRIGSQLPALFGGVDAGPSVARLMEGDEVVLPVDPTQGDALKVVAARVSVPAHLKAGGLTMIPLGIIGLSALVLAVWKLFALRRICLPSAETLDAIAAHMCAGDISTARAQVEALGPPLSAVLLAGIDHANVGREHLEEIMHERAMSVIPVLDRHLGMLAVLGGVAPLLGLLGTVTGMIHTFQLVTVFGTGDARLLSGGISEALVTTEVGLIIAVPVLLVHAYLSRRARMLASALEQTVIGYVNRIQGGARDG